MGVTKAAMMGILQLVEMWATKKAFLMADERVGAKENSKVEMRVLLWVLWTDNYLAASKED